MCLVDVPGRPVHF
ncbi:rCG62150 [Rattus norvegicus]|uniref:RCG62150 n=1 Tax=Rattus norvegicus TaxID=10116 RepID=A6HBS1_RAT|nr:rCG62150 [Rattus norvegicus]